MRLGSRVTKLTSKRDNNSTYRWRPVVTLNIIHCCRDVCTPLHTGGLCMSCCCCFERRNVRTDVPILHMYASKNVDNQFISSACCKSAFWRGLIAFEMKFCLSDRQVRTAWPFCPYCTSPSTAVSLFLHVASRGAYLLRSLPACSSVTADADSCHNASTDSTVRMRLLTAVCRMLRATAHGTTRQKNTLIFLMCEYERWQVR